MQTIELTSVLGGENVLNKSIENRMDLVDLGRTGVNKDSLLHLADYLSLSLQQMAQLLPITKRTIQKYTPNQNFNRNVSEKIIKIAEVAAKGSEVFGNRERFLKWLNKGNKALNDKAPASLLGSNLGIDLVLDELGRIEHGVSS